MQLFCSVLRIDTVIPSLSDGFSNTIRNPHLMWLKRRTGQSMDDNRLYVENLENGHVSDDAQISICSVNVNIDV